MHGVFDENAKLAAGLTTVNDIWNIIPYENLIVTATLSPEEIKAVMEEVYASHEPRSLLGIAVRVEGHGLDRRIISMTFPDGRALERDKRYVIAVNSFDARSGGHHFMKLRALLDRPEANCVLHPVQTRDAVIDYFRRHKVVQRIAIMVDAVMHGVFDENAKLAAGLTTVNDIWNIIPYENLIVTATLSPDEIKGMMEEVYASHEPRSLLGIAVRVEGRGLDRRITSMTFPDGRALERDKRYVIAVNSFDARSGGHHFMKLRALLDRARGELRSAPSANTRRGDRLFPAAQSCAKDCRDNAARDRGVISPVRPCKKNRFRLPISPCDFGFFALLVCC